MKNVRKILIGILAVILVLILAFLTVFFLFAIHNALIL